MPETKNSKGNPLRDLLDSSRPLTGSICGLRGADAVETMARAGFDYLLLDMQHGSVDRDTLVSMLRALDITGTPSLVRVPWNRPELVGWVLDAGAHGVAAPMINTAKDARELVAACRYGPAGLRSWGPFRPMLARSDYSPKLGDQAVVCAMLETAQAMENLQEIVDVEGLDLILVGQSDLSISFGLHHVTGRTEAAHIARLQRILDACAKRRLPVITNCAGNANAKPLRELGFRHFVVNSDMGILRAAATAIVQDMKQ